MGLCRGRVLHAAVGGVDSAPARNASVDDAAESSSRCPPTDYRLSLAVVGLAGDAVSLPQCEARLRVVLAHTTASGE